MTTFPRPILSPTAARWPRQPGRLSIDVIAPSGSLQSGDELDRGLSQLRALGCEVRNRIECQPWLRFAGTDEARLAQIHDAARQSPDLVMIARGGYGLSRLLDRIDWPLVSESIRRGTRWMGFSDFTAFQLALLAETGDSSWAGFAVCGDFGVPEVDAATLACFSSWLQDGAPPEVAWSLPVSDQQMPIEPVEGILWGGNLAMIASLVGTRWLPRIDDGLLFVEDVGEHPYRVERMLLQLLHSGVLARQRALLLGEFTGWRAAPHDNGFDIEMVAGFMGSRAGIPVIRGLPFGHVRARALLGVGLRYRLELTSGQAGLVPVSSPASD